MCLKYFHRSEGDVCAGLSDYLLQPSVVDILHGRGEVA